MKTIIIFLCTVGLLALMIFGCADSILLIGSQGPNPSEWTPAEQRAIKASLDYIAQEHEHMITEPNSLRVNRVKNDNYGYWHIKFDQYYGGVIVFTRQIIAHLTPDFTFQSITGRFLKILDLDTTPTISSDEATEIAFIHSRGVTNEPLEQDDLELVVFHWEGINYLSWRMYLKSDTSLDKWEYFIDAHTGEVIHYANRVIT